LFDRRVGANKEVSEHTSANSTRRSISHEGLAGQKQSRPGYQRNRDAGGSQRGFKILDSGMAE
jgi:hypothetical protein